MAMRATTHPRSLCCAPLSLPPAAAYVYWGRAERQAFDGPDPDNEPFAFERWLSSLRLAISGGSAADAQRKDE